MKKIDYRLQPLLILLFAIFLLIGLYFIPANVLVHYHLKRVNILSDILPKNTIIPPMQRIATKDSNAVGTISEDATFLPIVDADSIINLQGDTSAGMGLFFQSLMALGNTKKKIRIAYFGDSVIEGDLITENLRRKFQNTYGGYGVGFVATTSVVASFRKTIIHNYSPNWNSISLVNPIYKGHEVGISGCGFFAPIDSSSADTSHRKYVWARYWTVKNRIQLNKFRHVRLFYGVARKPSNLIFYDGNKSTLHSLNKKQVVNEVLLSDQSVLHTAQIGVSSYSKQNIFGVSFESDSGIILDNFSLRGNSGIALQRIPQATLQGFQQHLNYDLIVLHYGLNVLSSTYANFDWYERGMTKVLEHIKKAFPHTAILLIGISDKSSKIDDTFITEPNLKYLLKAQYSLAKAHHTGFFNLYNGMGGENAMVSWVQADTALANKDYTHFNFRGAEKVSEIIYQWINQNYNEYKKKHP